MPQLEVSDLQQSAVYWPFIGYDGDGLEVYGAAKDIVCRWLKKRSEKKTADNTTVVFQAQIATDFEPIEQSRIWLGTIATISGSSSDPIPEEGLHIIQETNNVPDIKGKVFRYESLAMRL